MDFGCSAFSTNTLDGKHFLSRTYDQFGDLKSNNILFVPRGTSFELTLSGENSSKSEGKFAFVGMAVQGLSAPIMVDGINEKGLMCALLNFSNFGFYEKEILPDKRQIHCGFFLTAILAKCASIAEVCAILEKTQITNDLIFGSVMSVHYIISDKSGESIIIEPCKDGLKLHRESLGVLTNSPEYSWHVTNLTTYSGVTNLPKNAPTFGEHECTPFGNHLGGGFGLPGDYSSPSRFIRLAFAKQFAPKVTGEKNAVSSILQTFAPVDIPTGLIAISENSNNFEQSLCTSIMCSESNTYYFSTHKNRRVSAVRLENLLNRSESLTFAVDAEEDILYLC